MSDAGDQPVTAVGGQNEGSSVGGSASPAHGGLPVFGYPGAQFWLIHITADVSIGISIAASLSVLAYMAMQKKNFWKRPLSERLVAYIAMGDFLFSSSHAIDHTALMILRDHPDDVSCIAMAFLLVWFFIGQSLIVVFTAVNAAVMVILQKRLNLGRYDWKLLGFALGVPLLIGILTAATRVLGPSGAWCFIDMRKPNGPMYGNLFTVYQVCIIILMALSYGGVWIKIKSGTSKVAASSTNNNHKMAKYNKSAKVMTIFVVAYILQYWPAVMQGFWVLATPFLPFWLILLLVGISNLGGLFNLSTYTIIRKKFTTAGKVDDAGTTIATDTGTTRVA